MSSSSCDAEFLSLPSTNRSATPDYPSTTFQSGSPSGASSLHLGQSPSYRDRWHVLLNSFRAWADGSAREKADKFRQQRQCLSPRETMVRPGGAMPRRGTEIPGTSSGPVIIRFDCDIEPYTDRCPPSPPPRTYVNDPRAPPQPDWAPPAVEHEATTTIEHEAATTIGDTLVVSPPVISMYGLDVIPVNDGSFDWQTFSLLSFEDWSQLRASAWFW